MYKASPIYWITQLTGWGVFCGLIAITSYMQNEFDLETRYRLLELYILLILVTHGMRYLLIRLDWLNLKLVPLIPRVLFLNISAGAILLLLSGIMNYLFFQEPLGRPVELIVNVLLYSIFFVLWSAVYLTYHLLRKSRKQELYNLQLVASNREIELKTLRDQLNPHFLFNSLNSIRALIEVDPSTAKSATTTLSKILRDSLQLGKRSFISLEEELKLVTSYLKLEKIRFEERLQYKVVNQLGAQLLIPPFILQTLTENAIKHGISKKSEGGEVIVQTFREEAKIYLQVINTGAQYDENHLGGVGIENTRRRLELQYGKNAGFTIKNKDNFVVATVWINELETKKRDDESTGN